MRKREREKTERERVNITERERKRETERHGKRESESESESLRERESVARTSGMFFKTQKKGKKRENWNPMKLIEDLFHFANNFLGGEKQN